MQWFKYNSISWLFGSNKDENAHKRGNFGERKRGREKERNRERDREREKEKERERRERDIERGQNIIIKDKNQKCDKKVGHKVNRLICRDLLENL